MTRLLRKALQQCCISGTSQCASGNERSTEKVIGHPAFEQQHVQTIDID